jgi:hypothetical protein
MRTRLRHPKTRKLTKRRALTLVETAVTSVTLALLAACLLPAAAGVSRDSKEARCLSNLGQIGYASLLYAAEDPNGWSIPVHPAQFLQDPTDPAFIGSYEWGGKSGAGRPGYVDGPSEGDDAWVTSRYGTKAGFGPARRPLNVIIYGDLPDYTDDPGEDYENWLSDTMLDLDVFRCPADTGYTGAHCPDFAAEGRTSYDHYGTSYAANLFMTAASQAGAQMYSNSPYLRPLSRVPNPAATLAYQENNGKWAWAVGPENPDCQWIGPGWPGAVGSWHGKDWTFGATFVDGHADWIYMRGYRNPHVFRDSNEQDYNRCIIVRGDGWQKDTLPAPTIPTGLIEDGGGRPSYEDCFEYGLRTHPQTNGCKAGGV